VAANKAIAINNLREDAHRLAIRALAAAGRRADALKRYEHLVALLKSELRCGTRCKHPGFGTLSPPAQSGYRRIH
jgi:hypothetical protein